MWVGGGWGSLVSHFASTALTMGHLQWLLCTLPTWIAGVGGSLRTAEEAFSPEACFSNLRSLPVSRRSGPGPRLPRSGKLLGRR